MNEQELKAYVRELCEPILDSTVSMMYRIMDTLMNQLPSDMPMEQKKEWVMKTITSISSGIEKSMKELVPENLADLVKEQMKNGK